MGVGGSMFNSLPNLDFPWHDRVNEQKKKGRLKLNTKVEIRRISNLYFVDLLDNFPNRYYWVLYFSLVTANWGTEVILKRAGFAVNGLIFLIIYLSIMAALSVLLFFSYKGTKTLGTLMQMSDIFIEFLNKFGKGWGLKLTCSFGKKWWLEYDILLMAYQWYKRDPVGFQQAFRKAKNKKELRIILGVN